MCEHIHIYIHINCICVYHIYIYVYIYIYIERERDTYIYNTDVATEPQRHGLTNILYMRYLLSWLETRLAQNTFTYLEIAQITLKHQTYILELC